jgi:hypothetical protein
MTSLASNLAGAFGFSTTGLMSGALKMLGVPSQAAEMAGFAAEIARGASKDGFDFSKVNMGALARHAMGAFGVSSPRSTMAAAVLGGSASSMMQGFSVGAVSPIGLQGSGLGNTALAGLAGMQGSIMTMLAGIAGSGGLSASDIAGTGMNLAFGNNTAQVRQMTGMTRSNLGPGSMLASLPKPAMFEDIVMAFMIDVVKDKQQQVEDDLKNLQAEDNAAGDGGDPTTGGLTGQAVSAAAPDATQAAQDGNSDSRNIQFEIIKNEIQKLSQMQQAMSNVLDTMNDQAMNAIRKIKSG